MQGKLAGEDAVGEMTCYDWLDFWGNIGWLGLIAAFSYFAICAILILDKSWRGQWLALAGYTLMFVPLQALIGLELITFLRYGTDGWVPFGIVLARAAILAAVLHLARHYFRCGWPAATVLAIVTLVLSIMSAPVDPCFWT